MSISCNPWLKIWYNKSIETGHKLSSFNPKSITFLTIRFEVEKNYQRLIHIKLSWELNGQREKNEIVE